MSDGDVLGATAGASNTGSGTAGTSSSASTSDSTSTSTSNFTSASSRMEKRKLMKMREDTSNKDLGYWREINKEALIDNYLGLEKTVAGLEARVEEVRGVEERRAGVEEADYDFALGEFPMSPNLAASIRSHQQQIAGLRFENRALKFENMGLKLRNEGR